MTRAGAGRSPSCRAACPNPSDILPNHKNRPKIPIYNGEAATLHPEDATPPSYTIPNYKGPEDATVLEHAPYYNNIM